MCEVAKGRSKDKLYRRRLSDRAVQAYHDRRTLKDTVMNHPFDSVDGHGDSGRDLCRICHRPYFKVRFEIVTELAAKDSAQPLDHFLVALEAARDLAIDRQRVLFGVKCLAGT
jgi:hypothetical protein